MGTRVKNQYISDLTFNNDSAIINLQYSEDPNIEGIIKVVRNNDGTYQITDILCSMRQGFNDLMYSRYVSKKDRFDEETVNVRLRDIQYQFRKFAKEGLGEVEVVEKKEEKKAPKPRRTKKEAPTTEEVEAPKVTLKVETPQPKVGLEAMIHDTVQTAIESNESTETINKVINKFLDDKGIVPNQTHIVVERKKDDVKINLGAQHYQFKTILKCLEAKTNVCLVGPAGSGKTTAVEKSAQALGLPFYSKSVSSQTGTHDFFGYQDANGKYVRTLFREAYENGGVYLLDEFDAGNPNVLASMNQATSNGCCSFPDGMITKHEDFIVVMAGNTYGHGATSEYVGRNAIDAATLDRFVFINFQYDESFELMLATNQEWAKKVQAIRKRVTEMKIKTVVSPRATIAGEKLLKVGFTEEEVIQMVIYKGMTKDEISLLKTA